LEHGNLIVQPNLLLAASLGLVIAIPFVVLLSSPNTENREPGTAVATVDLFRLLPWLKRLLKWRGLQFATQVPTLALLYLMVLAGLLGTKVPGRNIAIMLPWVVWLFLLAAVLVPLGGRLWCLICPLPVFGEWLQRRAITEVRPGQTGAYRNRFFGLFRRWPQSLTSAWPRTLAFLIVGTLGTLLVCKPKATAWALIILTLLPLGMALVWELRAFCRYVCPINAFIGLYAMAGRLAVRPTKVETCRQCQIRSCQLGNERGWPCPYGLCVGEMTRNNDCGLCTECMKSCAYDNVSLYWQRFGADIEGAAPRNRVSSRNPVSHGLGSCSEAWQAIALLTMAFAYAVTHLGPWPAVRNWVDIVDKGNWASFLAYGGVLWAVALLGAPLLFYGVVWACGRVGGWASTTFIASAEALVPIGLFAWMAIMVPMVMVNATFVLCTLSDPFGLNWNLFGTAGLPWWQIEPAAIPWIQAGCVLAGLWYSLRAAERGQRPPTGLLMLIAALLLWLFVG
ncbi:MAG: 4Fe-4S binding protein, partial [Planctomycetes bacterium]|nr:4Fe-4S binding protein [Planctomycetota bacterium]